MHDRSDGWDLIKSSYFSVVENSNEIYIFRYHRPIAVSELYKMKEAVSIQGDSGSRIVFLNTEYCNTPSLPDSEESQVYSKILFFFNNIFIFQEILLLF